MRNSVYILALLALTGCGVYNPIYVYCPLDSGCSYVAKSDNDWLEPAVREAVRFWNDHGANVSYDPNGMTVEVAAFDIDGESWFSEPEQKILISPKYNKPFGGWKEDNFWLGRMCVAVHEVGHSFGMPHTPQSDEGVMSPVVGLDGGTCAWTKGDQLDLDELKSRSSE